GLDVRDTGVGAMADAYSDGLLIGDLERLRIRNLGWKLMLQDHLGRVAQASGAAKPRGRLLPRFEHWLGKFLRIVGHHAAHNAFLSQNGRRESEAISAVMNVWRPAARAAEVDARRGGFGGRGGVAQPKRRFVNPSSCSAGYSVSHATNLKISDDFMNAKTGS